MAELRIRTARHTVRVAAAPRRVYQLIADVNRWPQIFDPTVAVEHIGFDGVSERARLWELIDGDVRSNVMHREHLPQRMQVRFRQLDAEPPVASMGGLWLVMPKRNGALVALDHYYRVVDDDPAEAQAVAEAIDRHSVARLATLRETAEVDAERDDLWLSCVDSVDVNGDARDVYEFLARVQDWPRRPTQVGRLPLDEDGSTSTVRVCFPETHIVYKQATPPKIMRAHTGAYTVRQGATGVRATAQHTVLLGREAVAGLVAQGSTVDDVRASVLGVLHDLSLATLGRAKDFAETRRPAWADATIQNF